MIALVASNWDEISAPVKLTFDLLLLAGLAFLVHRLQYKTEHTLWSDLCIGIMYFFVLASMALVGQIYQIDVELPQSLLSWVAITTPLMLLARGSYLAWLWALAVTITYVAQVSSIESWIKPEPHLSYSFILFYIFSAPLILRIVGIWPTFVKYFRHHATALRSLSDLGAVFGAFICTFPWYDSSGSFKDSSIPSALASSGFATLAVVFGSKKLWPREERPVRTLISIGWSIAWVSLALGILPLRQESSQAVAAFFQFSILALLTVWALKKNHLGFFRLFVALSCLRILIAYFEVFGTLLDTGLALIGGGLLILLMAALWRRWIRPWSSTQR